MKQRIMTGLIAGLGFLYFVWSGGIPYIILIEALAVIGYYEWIKMNHTKMYSVESILGFLAVVLLILVHNQLVHGINQMTVILVLFFLYLILTVAKKNHITIDQIGYFFLGVLYVGFGFAYMLETRLMGQGNGFALTLLILVTTWASDSGAYFTGKYLGKNKLWPEISPKKTIEGALGGMLFAAIAAVLMNYFFVYEEKIWFIFFIGLFISVIGQIGDLAESALKRAKEVKDSGTILPGHGGVLDRFDSLLFVFPILHLFLMI